jgi:hypothetical protein
MPEIFALDIKQTTNKLVYFITLSQLFEIKAV